MLQELSVRNLALIEDVRVEGRGGFCAWTGETGAGKSLLLTALGMVLGAKVSAGLVRSGETEAKVTATFGLDDPATLDEIQAILGRSLDEPRLVLTRHVDASGRSRAWVNEQPVGLPALRRLGGQLVDIHGQDLTRDLLAEDRQRDLLDAHGGLAESRAVFERDRVAHSTLLRRRNALVRTAETRRRERELLAFESEELVALDPRPGELEELTREAARLGGLDQLREASAEGFGLLYEQDGSVQEQLRQVLRKLRSSARHDEDLARVVDELGRLAEEVGEIAYTLRAFGREADADPARLEAIEFRLASYRKLVARFRCPADELAARRDDLRSRLTAIEAVDANLERLDAPLRLAWEALRASSATLTAARVRAAGSFAAAVRKSFQVLGLESAELTLVVEPTVLADDPTMATVREGGADRVELRFAANPGEAARPLARVASGGERSRVMLAIKAALAGVGGAKTLVFDEIDAGVGGRLGSAMGRLLADLARHHQVLCVTHLPQVACFAEHQWVIRKETRAGRTSTRILPLGDGERIEEIAQMLRGRSASEGTRQEAASMLKEGRLAREVSLPPERPAIKTRRDQAATRASRTRATTAVPGPPGRDRPGPSELTPAPTPP